MDNSFDERCETDISDCFEDILEGEEEVFFFLFRKFDHESNTLCSL